jgi:hypothetical protein
MRSERTARYQPGSARAATAGRAGIRRLPAFFLTSMFVRMLAIHRDRELDYQEWVRRLRSERGSC